MAFGAVLFNKVIHRGGFPLSNSQQDRELSGDSHVLL
jgi:hypothetical protein